MKTNKELIILNCRHLKYVFSLKLIWEYVIVETDGSESTQEPRLRHVPNMYEPTFNGTRKKVRTATAPNLHYD